MRGFLKWALIVLGCLLIIALAGPFLVPVPALSGTVPPEELADPDSRFIRLSQVNMHYKEQGNGKPTLLLLHGFAASTYSWQQVMPVLSEDYRVVAFDRPAFGLTSRPMTGEWTGDTPYSLKAHAEQTIELMDKLGIGKAVLIGHSAGGLIAALVALEHPERVQALVLVDAAIYSGNPGGWLEPLLNTPQADHLGPLLARSIVRFGDRLAESAWYDVSKFTPEMREGYFKPLRADNWDRALWEFTKAAGDVNVVSRLKDLKIPVLVISGEHDRIVSLADSERLAREIPGAELVVIPLCGHVPQEEQPEQFLKAVSLFLSAPAE